MNNGVTLGLIVKDEAKNLQRIHDAHHPELIFDEVVVTDTGSTDNSVALAESFGWRVTKTPWTNHFGDARNANLAECKTRWYCWMDADDTIENIAYLPNLAKTCEGRVGAVIFPYWYALNGAGRPTTIITRERLVDLTATKWTWKNRVHETLVPEAEVPVLMETGCVWVHRPDPTKPESAKRNLDLLLLDMKEGTADDSVYFYLGAQYLALKDYPQAVAWFKVSIERGRRPDMVWRSCEYGADALRIMALGRLKRGDKEGHDALVMESIDLDLRGIEIMPTWADCYFGLAEAYTIAREWEKAISWHEIGLTKKECDPVINMNPFDYTYRPFVYSHIARMSLGDIEGALKDVEKALEVAPTDEDLLGYKEQYEASLYEREVAEAALTIAGCTADETLPALVDALPVVVRQFRDFRDNVFGRIAQIKHPGRPIIDFFCGQAPEEWGPPSLIEGGIGGSETAVIHVARLLAAKGARVRVLGNPGVYAGIFDGVEYYDWDTYPQQERRNVLVIWRTPRVADYDWQAKRTIFWAHDLNYGDGLVGVGRKLDYICGVSAWHSGYLAQTYPLLADKMNMLRNGIDLSRYADLAKTPKDKNTIIWSSSPDRGLHYLLPMMPLWATINPDIKVHVYYGMHGLEAQAQAGDEPSQAMLRNIRTLVKKFEKFVVWHGRVNQTELAQAQMAASYWFYPTRFTEVSCCVGDTLIDMPRDYRKYPTGIPIKDLVGKSDFLAYAYDTTTHQIVLGKVKWVAKTGFQKEVWRLTLDDGNILRATPDHKIMTRDGEYVELQHLKPGMSLMPLYKNVEVMVNRNGGKYVSEKRMIAEAMLGRPLTHDDHVHHVDNNEFNNDPANLSVLSESEHHAIHAKRFGPTSKPVRDRQRAAQRKVFDSMSPEEKERRCAHFGSKAAQGFWDGMTPEARATFVEKRAAARQYNHKVVSVAFDGYEDVYDMEVEQYHNFVASGIVIHNCITALEAQAAHLNIVVSDLAALPETLNGGGILIPGSPDLPITNRVFVGEASFMVANPFGMTYQKQQDANVAAQTWENVVAADWLPKIEDVL